MAVSALVLTFNEESNIERCLDSLAWCDDIVVVDSISTDETVSCIIAAISEFDKPSILASMKAVF